MAIVQINPSGVSPEVVDLEIARLQEHVQNHKAAVTTLLLQVLESIQ
jgi:hypothetical protein